jgi:hypothetical protein
MSEPAHIGDTLEELMEQIIFADPDPAIQRLKQQWEESKIETQKLFERVCQEQYELRRTYHRICREPNPEELASNDLTMLRPVLEEEREERLTKIWGEVLRKVEGILEERKDEEQ